MPESRAPDGGMPDVGTPDGGTPEGLRIGMTIAMTCRRQRAVALVIAALVALSAVSGHRASGEDAVGALDGADQESQRSVATSVWAGVYTKAQAERGEVAYTGPCSQCHGYRLDGAPDDPDMLSTPPIAGAKFLRDWQGRSLAALLEYSRATMPANNPGYLSVDEYTDIIAYMLLASSAPVGEIELPSDQRELERIVISPGP